VQMATGAGKTSLAALLASSFLWIAIT
jgi:superfamily II DNA or RNA helicase